MPPKETFADVIGELLRKQGAVCAICESPERASIETARKQGAPFMLIARALMQTKTIDPNITPETASKRVRVHFTVHVKEK